MVSSPDLEFCNYKIIYCNPFCGEFSIGCSLNDYSNIPKVAIIEIFAINE